MVEAETVFLVGDGPRLDDEVNVAVELTNACRSGIVVVQVERELFRVHQLRRDCILSTGAISSALCDDSERQNCQSERFEHILAQNNLNYKHWI